MTDHEGHFAIDLTLSTIPGSRPALALIPRKPGYSQVFQPVLVSLDSASVSENLELKLMPVCSISGRVTTGNGEAAVEVNVSLVERQIEDGQPVWRQRDVARTNSRGEFRFSSLEPAEHTVLTLEWQGEQPAAVRLQQGRKVITRQYPPDFAGDTTSFEAATKLRLHFGDAPDVELHLRAARYYPVSIPVAGGGAGVYVQVSGAGDARSAANFNGFSLGYNIQDQADPVALAPYLIHAVPIEVSESGPKQITLSRPIPPQALRLPLHRVLSSVIVVV